MMCGQMYRRQNQTNTMNAMVCPISVALMFMSGLG